jgi:hypothetical protein
MTGYSETVTGRTYTATRARGLAEWSPQQKTVELLRQVNAVLDEYRAHLDRIERILSALQQVSSEDQS